MSDTLACRSPGLRRRQAHENIDHDHLRIQPPVRPRLHALDGRGTLGRGGRHRPARHRRAPADGRRQVLPLRRVPGTARRPVARADRSPRRDRGRDANRAPRHRGADRAAAPPGPARQAARHARPHIQRPARHRAGGGLAARGVPGLRDPLRAAQPAHGRHRARLPRAVDGRARHAETAHGRARQRARGTRAGAAAAADLVRNASPSSARAGCRCSCPRTRSPLASR